MGFDRDVLDEKTRRAFEEGLAHIRMAHTWGEQEDENRKERELKRAIKSLDKVISKAPNFDEGWVQLIRAYFEMRDFRLAQFLLEKAEIHVPRSASFLKTKGMIFETLGAWKKAARVYGQLHRLEPMSGFDKKQQQMLERVIVHEAGQPELLETEEQLYQFRDARFAWNTSEAQDATITFTTQRILCIGRKVPADEQGFQPRRLMRRKGPPQTGHTPREELHIIVPLNSIETTRKMRFYARYSLHMWDREDNHLVIIDPPEDDIDAVSSLLGKHKIETGEVEAKICTFFLITFVGSLLLSLLLIL